MGYERLDNGERPAPARDERGSVLVVDDNVDNLRVMSAILTGAGLRPRQANSGELALRSALASPPDLVLLDICMPTMDGFETCRRLKAEEPLRDVPVIFISALGEVADKVRAFTAGGVDYITKPFQAEEVLARVTTHITLYRLHRTLEEREEHLHRSYRELEEAHCQLKELGAQLVQSEKMASIGQLAAGVAHEINNPVGYINSNVVSLEGYLADLLRLVEAYEATEGQLDAESQKQLAALKQEVGLTFLRDDARALISETKEGIQRVKGIVQDLKEFSRVHDDKWLLVDLHKGIDSTLNIVWNEIKYKADVRKEYGVLPPVECIPSQLNQVFMNLLINAAQAIDERGTITVRTGTRGTDWVWVAIADTGAGIKPEHLSRLFDPFFTTKPVGQGTGLGLSLSYSIIAHHGGHIDVESQPGAGAVFTIHLPLYRTPAQGQGQP